MGRNQSFRTSWNILEHFLNLFYEYFEWRYLDIFKYQVVISFVQISWSQGKMWITHEKYAQFSNVFDSTTVLYYNISILFYYTLSDLSFFSNEATSKVKLNFELLYIILHKPTILSFIIVAHIYNISIIIWPKDIWFISWDIVELTSALFWL